MSTVVTTDTILNFLRETVEEKRPLPPSVWLDACMKLTVLLEDEHDKLFELGQMVARKKFEYINGGESVAKAKVFVETTKEFVDMQKQSARISRIEELVRIAKVQARMRDTGLGIQ